VRRFTSNNRSLIHQYAFKTLTFYKVV